MLLGKGQRVLLFLKTVSSSLVGIWAEGFFFFFISLGVQTYCILLLKMA